MRKVSLHLENPVSHHCDSLIIGYLFPAGSATEQGMEEPIGAIGQLHHGFSFRAHGTACPFIPRVSIDIHHASVLDLYLGSAAHLAELATAFNFLVDLVFGKRQ